jgi:uncharacterized membrane protein YozB (DUF420 family)
MRIYVSCCLSILRASQFCVLFILVKSQFKCCLSSKTSKLRHSTGKMKNIYLNLVPGHLKICIIVMWCILALLSVAASVYMHGSRQI